MRLANITSDASLLVFTVRLSTVFRIHLNNAIAISAESLGTCVRHASSTYQSRAAQSVFFSETYSSPVALQAS